MSSQFSMKSYMKGALLLTVAALIVKVLSAVYRVPFQNLVGDQGLYVYQQVYPFISFFVVWTSGGVAVAISKMLAHTNEEMKRSVIKVVFQYLTVLSFIFFAFLFFGANMLASWMGDPLLAPLLKTGAFVTLCMPALAVMKGSFQARGMMKPVAYAQIFEQTIRVSIILVGTVLIMMVFSRSIYEAGNMAMLGAVIGEVAGLILLVVYMKKSGFLFKESKKIAKWPVIKEVTIFSITVSVSSLLLLAYQLVDSFTVFSMLVDLGMPTLEAMETKGIYDRGQPLVQLGIVIASSFSLAIVPLVAHKSKKGTHDEVPYIQLTYRASLLFGLAASLGLILVMPYANTLLFKTDALSSLLMLYVLQIIWLSIILTFTSILQGYGKLKVPTYFLLVALLLKIGGNLLFIPLFGVLGVAIASNIGLCICALLLMYYLKKLKGISLATGSFYRKLFVASISMVIVVMGAVLLLNNMTDFSSMRMRAVVYSAVLVLLGAFTFMTVAAKVRILSVREWFIIPFGRKIATYQLWLNKKK